MRTHSLRDFSFLCSTSRLAMALDMQIVGCHENMHINFHCLVRFFFYWNIYFPTVSAETQVHI